MKRFLFFLSTSALLLTACKNGGGQSSGNGSDSTYHRLYTKSIKLKDLNTAIFAIQMVLLNDSADGLRDSLPELYGAVNNVEACMQTNEDALKRHPNEEKYLNIKVICLRQIGDMDGQFILLDQLYKQTHKPQYVAQMASLQLAGGQTSEALKTINFILEEYKNNKTDSLDIFLDEMNSQKVPVVAAAYNMKGYIYMQRKDITNAKEMYFKALEIYPEFEMPKRNLEAIFARKY
jgi:tetratricopeptide (TPR) repeat protein